MILNSARAQREQMPSPTPSPSRERVRVRVLRYAHSARRVLIWGLQRYG